MKSFLVLSLIILSTVCALAQNSIIHVIENNAGFSINVKQEDKLILSIITSGTCVNKGDQFHIAFTDGTDLDLTNGSNKNSLCMALIYLDNNYAKILSSKTVKSICLQTSAGKMERAFNKSQAAEFKKLF